MILPIPSFNNNNHHHHHHHHQSKSKSNLNFNHNNLNLNNKINNSSHPITRFNSINSINSFHTWQDSISTDLVNYLETKEIVRQSAIYEIITGELDYVDDLNTYKKIFIDPLQDQLPPTIFQPTELNRFSDQVLSTVIEIRNLNKKFLNQLLYRQNLQQPIIHSIGDIILSAVLKWGPAYIKYASDHPLGELEIERQMAKNPLFLELINNIPNLNPPKKDFRHYYSRATFRLARYVLLFSRLLEATPQDHIDRQPLQLALDLVRKQCDQCNSAIRSQQHSVALAKLNLLIVPKSDTPLLHLHSPNRKIYSSGKMIRKRESGTGLNEWNDILVVLFDHYFVMLKEKREDNNSRPCYYILEQPIRIEFLKLSGLTQPPEKRSRRLKNFKQGLLGNHNNTLSPPPFPLRRANSEPNHHHNSLSSNSNDLALEIGSSHSLQQSHKLFPITIHSFGISPRNITLYAESERARQRWRERFELAIESRLGSLKISQIFKLKPITLETFSVPSSTSSDSHLKNLPSLAELKILYSNQVPKELVPNSTHFGAPTCSLPFLSPHGKKLVAIGCSEGLWIGNRQDPSSANLVLSLKSITQIDVLYELELMIILTSHNLIAYSIKNLLSNNSLLLEDQSNSISQSNLLGLTNFNLKNHSSKPSRPIIPYLNQNQSLNHHQKLTRLTSSNSQKSNDSHHSLNDHLTKSLPSLKLSTIQFELNPSNLLDKESTSLSYDETLSSSDFFTKLDTSSSTCSSRTSSFKRRVRNYLSNDESEELNTSDWVDDMFKFQNQIKSNVIDLESTEKDLVPIKLTNSIEVLFFKIGYLMGQKTLIYVAKGKSNQTLLRILNIPIFTSINQIMNNKSNWIQDFKEITLSFEPHDLQFHESENKLLALYGNRVKIININGSISDSIPHLEKYKQEPIWNVLARRINDCKLLKVLMISNKEYLFCYDRFAYFATKNGDVIWKKFDLMIEWDGKPHTVIQMYDYVIGFSENLIEVWDLRTSERIQIIYGQDIRCIYDGKPNNKNFQQINRIKSICLSDYNSNFKSNLSFSNHETINHQFKEINRIKSTHLTLNKSKSKRNLKSLKDETINLIENSDGLQLKEINSKSQLCDNHQYIKFTENKVESVHVSLRQCGNVYRIFELVHLSSR